MSSCIFCRIVNKELPAQIIYEDDLTLAFHDKFPQAPTHILIIPKEHIATFWEVNPQNKKLAGAIFQAVQTIATEFDPDKNGFRLINNCGSAGLQTIYHLHFHFLAGRRLGWPPG